MSNSTLDSVNTWPNSIVIAYGFALILMMQLLWSSIQPLYFDYAYEIIVIPYTFYLVYTLYQYSIGSKYNKAKVLMMFISFGLLFLPIIHLIVTNQTDFETLLKGRYDDDLDHLKNANLLPYLALASLLIPYPDFIRKLEKKYK